MTTAGEDVRPDVGRRTVIKRGALIGGAMVWTMPAVQSISSAALANTPSSPENARCSFKNIYFGQGSCFTAFSNDAATCRQLDALEAAIPAANGSNGGQIFTAVLTVLNFVQVNAASFVFSNCEA